MKYSSLETDKVFLECERHTNFLLLMFVGGLLGAFTYTQRGGVFCNAQTANVLMMGINAGQGEWNKAFYYLLPICAYILGSVISEALPTPIRKREIIRWDTLLIFIEIIVIILLGFIPDTWPYQITQIAVNILMAMQYNTFRQSEGISMATTFCTNHVRQVGINLYKACTHKETDQFKWKLIRHLEMLFMFMTGAGISAWAGKVIGSSSVWLTIIPLGILFIRLLSADLSTEKDKFKTLPRGH